MARAKRLERKPALAVTVTVLFFAWLYLPILAVALFSFNDTKSLSAFAGFSTRWYVDFFNNARAASSPSSPAWASPWSRPSARSCSGRCWRWAWSGSGRAAAG